MDTVRLAGRTIRRLGLSAAGLRTTGMWGEPAARQAAVTAIRRAVELGAEVIEVPLPFGPAAGLVREAQVPDVLIVARLTGRLPELDVIRHRLGGRRPDLVLADPRLLEDMRAWPVPLGAVVTAGTAAPPVPFEPLAAGTGPYPAPPGVVEWCEDQAIPYLAPSTGILAAGALTVALPAPRSVTEVERLFSQERPTPPAAGPG